MHDLEAWSAVSSPVHETQGLCKQRKVNNTPRKKNRTF